MLNHDLGRKPGKNQTFDRSLRSARILSVPICVNMRVNTYCSYALHCSRKFLVRASNECYVAISFRVHRSGNRFVGMIRAESFGSIQILILVIII